MAIAVAAAVSVSAGRAAPAAPASDSSVLELPDEGFLQGRLLPAPPLPGAARTTVLWQSPLFAEPLEFEVGGVRRVRFPERQRPVEGGSWHAELHGGDFVMGGLESIDSKNVVMTLPGANGGTLRLRRGAVARLTAPGGAAKTIVPGSLANWRVSRAAWREEAGRLASATRGSWAYRDVAAPSRACFEAVLSWNERPEMDLYLGVDASRLSDKSDKSKDGRPAAEVEEFRLEALDGNLLAIREGATARFDRVASLPAGAGTLRLMVFIDREQGRMAVVLPDGGSPAVAVFDEAVPPRRAMTGAGFGILLRSGDIRIDVLRVTRWIGSEPRPDRSGDLGWPLASVDSFAAGILTLNGEGGPRRVAAADVVEISFPPPADAPEPGSSAVLATFHGGSRLTGRILEVTDDAVRLESPALDEPLDCGRDHLAMLEALNVQRSAGLPGRMGLLEAEGARMPGCLMTADGEARGLDWLPRGSVRPVSFRSPNDPKRITYRGIDAFDDVREDFADAPREREKPPPQAAPADSFQNTVTLKTGDSILCAAVSGGPEGLRIKTDLQPDLLVPAVAMRAVELLPSAAGSIPREKLARLLALPRRQQADPPTHLLRLSSGDYLRGKLLSLDDRVVTMEVLGIVKELPRSEAVRLIWLSVEADGAEGVALRAVVGGADTDGVPLRATFTGGRRLTLRGLAAEAGSVSGINGVFGPVSVDLTRCDHLELGPAACRLPEGNLPYAQWVLKPTPLPRALPRSPLPRPAGID